MNPRVLALAVAEALFVVVVIALAWGEVYAPSARTSVGIVTADAPGGRLRVVEARSSYRTDPIGIRIGDLIDVPAMNRVQQLRLYGGGTGRLSIPVLRGGVPLSAQLTFAPSTRPVGQYRIAGAVSATIALLIFGALAVRRPSLLTAALVAYGAGAINVYPVVHELSVLPDALFVPVVTILLAAFLELPTFLLLLFVTRFPHEPHTAAGRRRRRAADVLVVAAAVACVVVALFEPFPLDTWKTAHTALNVLGTGAVLAFTAASYFEAGGETRQRIGWVLIGLIVSDLTYGLYLAVDAYVPIALPVWDRIESIAEVLGIVLPVSVAYAVLRHRVIDVGFALNRAAVFTAFTMLIVGVFGGLQWAVNSFVYAQTRTQGFLIQLAIAVIVLYVVRVARTGTERFVSRVLFASRRRRIDAIEDAAKRTERIERLDELGSTVVAALASDAGIVAALYVRNGTGFTRDVGDAADIPEHVDLDGELAGASAFALQVRGHVRGLLVCRPPSREADFAPDEYAALEWLATTVAFAREDLIAEAQRATIRRLELELTELRARGAQAPPNP